MTTTTLFIILAVFTVVYLVGTVKVRRAENAKEYKLYSTLRWIGLVALVALQFWLWCWISRFKKGELCLESRLKNIYPLTSRKCGTGR